MAKKREGQIPSEEEKKAAEAALKKIRPAEREANAAEKRAAKEDAKPIESELRKLKKPKKS